MQKYKDPIKDDEDDSFDAGFTIPTSKSFQEALQKAHQDEEEEAEKQGKPKKARTEAQKQGGVICYCGNPSCRIGHFVETQR